MPLREVNFGIQERRARINSRGGGRILVDRVRKTISPLKINTDQWLEVMSVAHEPGIELERDDDVGHVETIEDRIEHLQRVGEQRPERRLSPRSSAGRFNRSTPC